LEHVVDVFGNPEGSGESAAQKGPKFFRGILLFGSDFLDPVAGLEVHQAVSLTQESFCVSGVTFLPQVLADQIQHRGEGAEVVVFLDMEL